MFGRNPNSAQMITVVEDNSSAPERTEDLLDHQTGQRIAKSEATRKQVLSNVELAQEKQKKQCEKRKTKGVKTFEIKVGDTVYKRQMKNVSRKGGKMEPGWMGPVCFHCEELAVFPVSSSKCVIYDKKEETIEVFCHCRMPFKDGVFMIECSVCLEWFHRSCDKVPRTVTDKTLFHCMNCK